MSENDLSTADIQELLLDYMYRFKINTKKPFL